ncbi:polyphenol oxidase family protein [Bifidobacterium samirii]|uniref:Copper oxidase n=1 Tax=Bifidobacterium samirii TaxID=2306974 RepID=A0A430FRC5_9BIFI|nr:polyphenol oxidase family protein [Bifidobacterium samirii]RSX55397.1 copper oxidase [Bifidobacterium samirii]
MTKQQYDDAILDSNEISPTDKAGNPIPVTIPIALAPGVTVTYTTRLGGVSGADFGGCNLGGKTGDAPTAVAANRRALADQLGRRLSLLSQVHSGIAVDVDDLWEENADYGFDASGFAAADTSDDTSDAAGDVAVPRLIEADAQVTSRRGIALGVFAADCLPVLLADAEAGVIGVAHCGRRGLEGGVIGATVNLMTAKGAATERIVATLGPCICGDCYEVGGDMADAFDARFPGTFTLSRFGQPGIDIAAAARAELAAAGIPLDNIVESRPRVAAATQYLCEDEELAGLCDTDGEGPALADRIGQVRHSMCTVENPLWHSHRRAALAGKRTEGRMLALIALD